MLLDRRLASAVEDAYIDRDARKGTKPSDHAPVVVDVRGQASRRWSAAARRERDWRERQPANLAAHPRATPAPRAARSPRAEQGGRGRSPGHGRTPSFSSAPSSAAVSTPSATIVAPDSSREAHQRRGERTLRGVDVETADELAVELDEVRGEPEDVHQARKARAGIVDRQAHACRAQPVECAREPGIVLDGGVLGELDDDPRLLDASEERSDVRARERLGPGVDGQHDLWRKLSELLDRRAQQRDLELDAEPGIMGLGEPDIGSAIRLAVEARQSLDGEDRAVAQVEDRLIGEREAALGQHVA